MITENKTKIIFPTIHLNGNSPKTLRDQYLNAADAVRKALDAVKAVDFHSRDYYPQGAEAFLTAEKHYADQLTKLSVIERDLLEVAEYCHNQIRKD